MTDSTEARRQQVANALVIGAVILEALLVSLSAYGTIFCAGQAWVPVIQGITVVVLVLALASVMFRVRTRRSAQEGR